MRESWSEIGVIFCLIQSMAGRNNLTQTKFSINHVLYDMQIQLQKLSTARGIKIDKAFVYGNCQRLCVRQFGESPVENIFYSDSTIFCKEKKKLFEEYKAWNDADAAHLLVIADKMVRQRRLDKSGEHICLVILTERQLKAEEIKRFSSLTEKNVPDKIFLLEREKYGDYFETFVTKKNGYVNTFENFIKDYKKSK